MTFIFADIFCYIIIFKRCASNFNCPYVRLLINNKMLIMSGARFVQVTWVIFKFSLNWLPFCNKEIKWRMLNIKILVWKGCNLAIFKYFAFFIRLFLSRDILKKYVFTEDNPTVFQKLFSESHFRILWYFWS